MNKDTINQIIQDVKNYIELEKESGIDEVMLSGVLKPGTGSRIEFAASATNKKTDMEKLHAQVRECHECALAQSRRNTVFGEGDPCASLMFVGEAPGLDEDIQGRPFVGKAGALLTKIIKAIDLNREEVFIANCLKCRPPQNRNPLPSEIIACRSYLQRQIEIIHPKVICCLGKFSAQTLLMTDAPISRLRGKFHDYNGIKVMPTFHPAYLLRNPEGKRLVWEDMKLVRDYLKE